MDLLIAIGLLCVVSITAGVLAFGTFREREEAVSRLQRVSERGAPLAPVREATPNSLWERVTLLVGMLSGSQVDGNKRVAYAERKQELIEAGFRRPGALNAYMGSRIALALGAAVLTFPAAALLSSNSGLAFAVLGLASGVGYLTPGLVVGARRSSRQRAIVRGLPDALDLMVVCVEAGLSLGATLDRVAKEFFRSNVVLASELKLVVLETQAGKSLSEALRALAARNGTPDLSTLASALVQTERLGTRVADTLRVQADALRTRRMQEAEEVAQRAPVKMLFPAVLFIFPALLVVILVPPLVKFFGSMG